MVFTWDSSFENLPTDTVSKSLIDNYIRDTKRAIRERMATEHEWGPGSAIDSGRHIGGGTTVMDKGDAVAMAAIANPQDGSLFLLTDGSDLQLHVYYSGDWHALSTLDHLLLTNRDSNPSGNNLNDPHPALFLQASSYNTPVGSIDMQNNFLLSTTDDGSTYAGLTPAVGFTKYAHAEADNPHRFLFNTGTAIQRSTILNRSLKIAQSSTVYNIANNTVQDIIKPASFPHICFFPQIYALTAMTLNIRLCSAKAGDFGILNQSGGAITARVRWESWSI